MAPLAMDLGRWCGWLTLLENHTLLSGGYRAKSYHGPKRKLTVKPPRGGNYKSTHFELKVIAVL